MGWFRRKINPVTYRVNELDEEIRKLEQRISSLKEGPAHNSFDPFDQYDEKINISNEEKFCSTSKLSAKTLENFNELNHPKLYNDQGVRKFDLYGWLQRIKKKGGLPEPNPNEKLVTYLATGRSHGYTALRKETRVARNRFILLTILLIGILWSILSLLVPQL
tara:strand:+ start:1158 stop:1646 length:489 start_codon:yes stop_codon:yes gene_type:complete